MELTHLDEHGAARMVDVSEKKVTTRDALAEGFIRMRPETLALITAGGMPKGDVFAVARVAGIMAAKRTSDLIPMCHPLPIDSVKVDIRPVPPDRVHILARVRCTHKTGVEMEALTAASVAALTVYDMCKAVDRGMCIENVKLMEKSGGKSGAYRRATLESARVDTLSPETMEDVSLLSGETLDLMRALDYRGLCMKKFKADLVTRGLDYTALRAGDLLEIGGAAIEITRTGKHCYPECPLRQENIACTLSRDVAFGKIVQAGSIAAGDGIVRSTDA